MDPTSNIPYRLRRLSIYFVSGEAQSWTFNDEWRLTFSRRDVILLQKPGEDGTAVDYIEVRKVAVAHWRLTTWLEQPKTVDPEQPAGEPEPELDLL